MEAILRQLGVKIVDEWGAGIDQSQFEREADPSFNTNVDPPLHHWLIDAFAPLWVVRWHHQRRVRQSSDDA